MCLILLWVRVGCRYQFIAGLVYWFCVLILGHGGEGTGGRIFGFDSLKSRLNRDFRLMWKDQRRWRTQRSRIFIISSRGAHSFWPWYYILYYRGLYILYHLDIELQVSRRSSRSVLEYLIEHGQKLCAQDYIMNERLRLTDHMVTSKSIP